ncbi:hypothetical protein [Bacillus inaquosorum]|uniref:hypothetical protein n=1 Tax=Bacillus inaquosorum TaxID=483913 RepID=UPI00227DB78C|nr:hypothetical protein [Bacillus inaquosorum]MCY7767073.1 hypothetical protein [Bacillus inaquosorum]MCY9099449.1 hypothetical protein [Bacillus inaquosorum]
MATDQEKQILATLFDKLKELVSDPEGTFSFLPQGAALQDTVYLQMCKNEMIDPSDFKNPRSPRFPQGDRRSAENWARLVDKAPTISQDVDFSQVEKSIDVIYGTVVQGVNFTTQTNTDPAIEARYQEALSILYKKEKDPNGTDVFSDIPTDDFEKYLQLKKNYLLKKAQLDVLKGNLNLDLPEDQDAWASIQTIYQGERDEAYSRWRTSPVTKAIEDAIKDINTLKNDARKSAFSDARTLWDTSKIPSIVVGGGLPDWHLTLAYPTEWYEKVENYTEFKLESRNLRSDFSHEATSYSGGATYNLGLWRVGGGGGGSSEETHFSMEATQFSLKGKIGLVTIERPWFNGLLFDINGWYLNGIAQGGLSNGQIEGNERSSLPLIPQALVIMRDIELSGNFSTAEQEIIKKSVEGSVSVGYGPFSLSGRYSHSSENRHFNSSFDGTTIKIPGMQVLARISWILPFSPPDPTPGSLLKSGNQK